MGFATKVSTIHRVAGESLLVKNNSFGKLIMQKVQAVPEGVDQRV